MRLIAQRCGVGEEKFESRESTDETAICTETLGHWGMLRWATRLSHHPSETQAQSPKLTAFDNDKHESKRRTEPITGRGLGTLVPDEARAHRGREGQMYPRTLLTEPKRSIAFMSGWLLTELASCWTSGPISVD